MANHVQQQLQRMNQRASTRKLSAKGAALLSTRTIAPMQSIPWVFQMRVVGTSEMITIKLGNAPIVVGRRAGNGGELPDFDLSPYGAFQCGVSRQHALFAETDEHLTIMDLESSNGTFINGRRLPVNRPVPLQNGDNIMFGDLKLQVHFNVMPTQDHTPRGNGQGQHLLVIEDDMDVAIAYRMMFERFGYQVSVTDDPAEVLLFVSQVKPALVICDLILKNLPKQRDVDIVHLLKRELPADVPILVVSGVTAGHQRQRALASGAADFMGKPVKTGVLLQKVNQLIDQFQVV